MDGLLNILKPPGMTSHDVVSAVRHATGMRRVGHTGTLDPVAAGVLPVCLGQATRLVEFLQAGHKEYHAEVLLGVQTDTLDVEGAVVADNPVPDLTESMLRKVLPCFTGSLQQVPPLYSAIKQAGQPLYRQARRGAVDIVPPPRAVTIFELELLSFQSGAYPRASLRVLCSAGTYLRSLARDLAEAVQTCGMLSFLLRTQSSGWLLDQAVTLEEMAASPETHLHSLKSLLDLCAAHKVVDGELAVRLAKGQTAAWELPEGITLRTEDERLILVTDPEATVAILARPEAGTLHPDKVFTLGAPSGTPSLITVNEVNDMPPRP